MLSVVIGLAGLGWNSLVCVGLMHSADLDWIGLGWAQLVLGSAWLGWARLGCAGLRSA